eukprot:14359646-Ditylum_brightwellii.AAC.1
MPTQAPPTHTTRLGRSNRVHPSHCHAQKPILISIKANIHILFPLYFKRDPQNLNPRFPMNDSHSLFKFQCDIMSCVILQVPTVGCLLPGQGIA